MILPLFAQEVRTQLRRDAVIVAGAVLVEVVVLALWKVFARVNVLSAIFQGIALLTLVAMAAVVICVLVAEYWQSMYGRRGYLTMSLPVRGRELFAAKVAYAFLSLLATTVVALLGLVAWTYVLASTTGVPARELLSSLTDVLADVGVAGTALFLVVLVVNLLVVVAEVGAVMSLGAEARWNHLGVGAPIIGGVVLYLVNQVLTLVSLLFVPVSLVLTGPEAGSLVARWMLPEFIEAVRSGREATLVGAGPVLTGPLLAAVLAWWAVRSIERRTSLR